MSGDRKRGMLEIIFGGLLISSLSSELKQEREIVQGRDIDYDLGKNKSSSKKVEKNLEMNNGNLLSKKEMERWIYNKDLYKYMELKMEKEIIALIERKYKDDYSFMEEIGEELYDLELYKAAESAYRVVIDNKDSIGDTWRILNAYKKIEDNQGLKTWRDKLSEQGENTWIIDRYLNDQDPEALKTKIASFEREKDWEKLIEYCNKYNKLILLHPWETMDKRVEYEFKKVEAYMHLNQNKRAWNSICKTRNILLSNFGEVEHLNYLSRAESYMQRICDHKDYPIDSLYHHIIEITYKDIFHYYKSGRKLVFKSDPSLKELLEKSNLKKLEYEIENIIQDEYNNISEKTIKRINSRLNNILKDNGYKFILEEPKKYYPKGVGRDFPVK